MPVYHIVLDLEMNPTALCRRDECGGLGWETIEIGAVKIHDGTRRVVDAFSCMVGPEFNSRVEPEITRLTGIKTDQVCGREPFSRALERLLDWIGPEPVRIYSWSNSDLYQVRCECSAKGIPFPHAMEDWTDFQAEFPGYLGLPAKKCINLRKAAAMIGIRMKPGHAHRALYDAEVTAELVLFALTGEYKHYISRSSAASGAGRQTMTYSIGEACGPQLAALLARMKDEKKKEELCDVRTFYGGSEVLVR